MEYITELRITGKEGENNKRPILLLTIWNQTIEILKKENKYK